MSKWEKVSDADEFPEVYRLQIEGGWLYRMHPGSSYSPIFVPYVLMPWNLRAVGNMLRGDAFIPIVEEKPHGQADDKAGNA